MSAIKHVSTINKVKDGKHISYTVERTYDNKNSLLKTRYMNMNGQLHREGDKPAYIKYDYTDNNEVYVCVEYWYENGKKHRDGDKPAHIEYYNMNVKHQELWYQNDKIHRDGDMPAHIFYDDNGLKSQEYWYQHDKIHRDDDKPACIRYKNNNVVLLSWYKNDKIHREGGKPAIIKQDYDGIIYSQTWYLRGKMYSPLASEFPGKEDEIEDGYRPAWIEYFSSKKYTQYTWVKPDIRICKLKYDNQLDREKYQMELKTSKFINDFNNSSNECKIKIMKVMDILNE